VGEDIVRQRFEMGMIVTVGDGGNYGGIDGHLRCKAFFLDV
jgi:hypothetical protein